MHEILGQCDMYVLNGSHFSRFLYVALLSTWLNLESLYLTQLCIYTGATYREEIIYLSIIFLKLWIFWKIHILHFLSHLTYMPKILILHLAYHTHTHTYTDKHRHIQIPFSHFALFGSFGIHAKYIWHTTDLHMHRYSDICTETLTHRYRYTETHASL